MSNKELEWHYYFLNLAEAVAKKSKDPSTKVGSIVVGTEKQVLSTGFNGFPIGMDDDTRLLDRETKYKYIVHAEMNAISFAAKLGGGINKSTIYTIGLNSETTFGFPPCSRCASIIIQAGIKKVITYENDDLPERWIEDMTMTADLFKECNIDFIQLPMINE